MADANPTPGDNGLGAKKNGIPLWIWVGGAVVLIVGGYYIYKGRQATAATQAASTTSQTATTDTSDSGIGTEQYETLLSQLRDLQGEESTQSNPPPPRVVSVGSVNPPPLSTSPPVSPPPPPPTSPPPPPPVTTSPTPNPVSPNVVTVQPYPAWNSTLWGIAQKEYGDGSQYPKIFAANENLIVGQEEAHGMSAADAQSRKWLYPGEAITVP
jgi:nucleoid-associated protein YgaU